MIDSGHYAHPFFPARGYRVSAVALAPGATNAADDEVGHGTGESCNIFAVAPDVQLLPVKMVSVNSTAAFNTAVLLGPDIITCSWGSDLRGPPLSAADQALAAAIATAVASGIVVVFSAGNGHFGFPGQHPDVISAGGTYMKPDGSMTASNYASGFISKVYPNRRVPDLCGLVGMKPKAIYIMFPQQPSDELDVDYAGSIFPNGDETANNDGWAAFSGTSAAAPQLAGASALVKQAFPRLNPAQVRSILMNTARDVTTGHCNTHSGGFPATVGPDTATGNGLVDAEKAALVARLRSLSLQYTQSVQLAQHGAAATEQARSGERGQKLSPEELKSLEEMVGRGEIGFRDMEE
jgi:subtilisin family serine protease